MKHDKNLFNLIKEQSLQHDNRLALDIGANQGFYTYFLASLGYEVHSFEIFEKNFKALQHGIFFNSPSVGKRVNLYAVGLSQKNSRFSMKGSNYEGFLNEGGAEQNIQGVTLDCFFFHNSHLSPNKIGFVKLDVEGFEIAVLKGAKKSLFDGKNRNLKGMLMEVGPKRWIRSSVSFNEGLHEMQLLSMNFLKTSVILRKQSESYFKTCPEPILSKFLSDKSTSSIYNVKSTEIAPLLTEMYENEYDCNFWFRN